jgi:hypothetical protein
MLTIPAFPYFNRLTTVYGDTGFKKNIFGLVFAWKSGFIVSLLPLGPSLPLQAILLSDLVGCDWMGSNALWEHIPAFFFKGEENPLRI